MIAGNRATLVIERAQDAGVGSNGPRHRAEHLERGTRSQVWTDGGRSSWRREPPLGHPGGGYGKGGGLGCIRSTRNHRAQRE